MRCLAFLAALMPAAALAGPTIVTDHIRAEISVRNATTPPGGSTDIAIAHSLDDGWHTYWQNPGDSGEPPIADWDLPDGGVAAGFTYPTPSLLPYPPLMNHGYSDNFTLTTSVTIPADWPAGKPYPARLRMDWLVCEEICVPEGGNVAVTIPTGTTATPNSAVAFTFMRAGWDVPTVSDAAATYSRDGGTLYLSTPVGSVDGAHFFAFQRNAIDHVAPQQAVEASDGEGITLTMQGAGGRLDGTLEGVLKTASGAWRITATGDADPLAPAAPAATSEAPLPSVAAILPADAVKAPLGLGKAMLFAFIGGLILNLMPCVFPVLALKALGLVAHADAPVSRRSAIAGAYTAGILASFAALLLTLTALKAAGESVGWGFQLQSPAFVAVMVLILFAMGLNLSGVFGVGAGLTRLGGAGPRDGIAGSFATGCLAVIVATPCTAPFMAVALGAALTSSTAWAVAVFAALALGLAAPFAALALVPGLSRILPRPGVWMERLKQALAFPLYATAGWLVWVLAQIAGVDALLPTFGALILMALGAWLVGLSQRGNGRSHRVASGLALASIAASLVALWPAATSSAAATMPLTQGTRLSQPYTPARLAQLQARNVPVFLNVTAAWCITCQVNERVAFAQLAFAEALADNGVVYLKADWTRRDPDVTRLIERFGRAGVPLYVYFPAGGSPQVLGQILTASALAEAFANPS